jgi:hypothetical protein
MSRLVHLCALSDAIIERGWNPEIAQLQDNEGNSLWDFPATMSDHDIRNCLIFANRAYAMGFRLGSSDKAREIRALLEIPADRSGD